MDEFDSEYLKGTPWGSQLSEPAGAAALVVLVLTLSF